MKQIFSKLPAVFIALLCAVTVQGQIKQSVDEKSISEVTILRQKLVAAIEKRDRKTLESLYADDYTHTHAIGQVDGKQKRIAALLSGEPTIESAAADEIKIRAYGDTTVVAIGQSTVNNKDGSQPKYRWTLVYVKLNKKWQIVASQAARLAEK